MNRGPKQAEKKMERVTGQAAFPGLFWPCPLLAAPLSNSVLAEPHNLHLSL